MLSRLRTYASFVRLGHSIFALPFALTGALLAAQSHPITWRQVAWIGSAMVCARSAAMSFNRIVDARFDAENPRTAGRELPRGVMSRREAVVFVVASSAGFMYAAFQLSTLCFALSPLALAIVFWYSLAKRYTWSTQFFLGLAMAVAPVGGWLAVGGRAGWEPWLLGLAIGLWVAGFDVLYACQDLEFDRAVGLYSVPKRFGIAGALWIARGMHVAMIALLIWLAASFHLFWPAWAGVAVVAALLAYEHSLVRPNDLGRLNAAFFTVNGYISLLFFVFWGAAVWLSR